MTRSAVVESSVSFSGSETDRYCSGSRVNCYGLLLRPSATWIVEALPVISAVFGQNPVLLPGVSPSIRSQERTPWKPTGDFPNPSHFLLSTPGVAGSCFDSLQPLEELPSTSFSCRGYTSIASHSMTVLTACYMRCCCEGWYLFAGSFDCLSEISSASMHLTA